MSLIPEITLKQLQQLDNIDIPTVNIVDDDGNYQATLVIPQKIGGMTIYDEIKNHAEYLGVRGNSVLDPKIVNDFMGKNNDVKKSTECPECGFIAKNLFGLNAHIRGKHKDKINASI